MAIRGFTVGAISVDTAGMDQKLARIQKDQLPYAQQLALNDLAFSTVRAERVEAQMRLDRPTPWFLNSIQVAKKATKKDPTAAVWIGETVRNLYGKSIYQVAETPRSTGVAIPQIYGGGRKVKSTEKRLRQIGVLRENEWLTPGGSARLNSYGNISGPAHVQMLSYFRSFREAGYNANRVAGASSNKRGIRYFINRAGSGRGIYRVQGNGKPKLIWYVTTDTPTYNRRFDFFGEAQRHASRFGPYFADKAITRALATAR